MNPEYQHALEKSEQKFRDFAESGADWFWEMDENLRFTYMSANVERIVGVPPEWHYGKTREDLLGEDYDRGYWAEHLETLKARQPFRNFTYLRTGVGVVAKWLSASGKPIFSEDGAFIGYRGTGTDVTALKQSETLFHDAIETISEGFALYDADERLVICNEPYKKTLPRISALGELVPGNKLEDIIRAGIKQGYIPPAYSGADEYLTMRLAEFRDPPGPYKFETSSGRWVRLEEKKTSTGGTVAIRTDITARKTAEAALKESEERLSSIIDNSPSAIFLKDLEGRYRLVNKRFAEWYGKSVTDIVGKTSFEIFPKKFAEIFTAQDREVQNSGRSILGEQEVRLTDNELHTMYFNKFPVRNLVGETIGIGFIGTDISDQKAMAAQLQQAQKMEAIGQLTGGVAHDFNNLLAVIMGNIEIVTDDFGGNVEALQAILRAAERGAELTHRLLAYSRQQPLNAKLANVNDMLPHFRQLAQRTIGEDITIELQLANDLWPILVDAGQLENALLNLAINARYAMSKGGVLSIETSNHVMQDEDLIDSEQINRGEYVMIAVHDTGTGMPKHVREKAFEPFFTTKDVGQGSGLGLSMVYGFAKQSGGHASIDSEPAVGTTVGIYLPRTDAAAPVAAGTKEKTAERPCGNETILVVEDDKDLREFLGTALDSLGYLVLLAPNGPAAQAILETTKTIDLLLTDVVLPEGMSGRKVAEIFRRFCPDAAVLFSSGYAREFLHNRGEIDEGVILINKPYQLSVLARTVRDALDIRNS